MGFCLSPLVRAPNVHYSFTPLTKAAIMEVFFFLALLACLAIGTGIGFLLGKAQFRGKLIQLSSALESERQMNTERLVSMKDTFVAIASDALKKNNDGFLTLAKETFERYQQGAVTDLEKREKAIEHLVKPVKETLDRFEMKIQEVEKERIGAYEGLTSQVKTLFESQKELRSETANLVHALKTPRIRGRWGEIQLRRVVELAGMIDHCDFSEQQSVNTDDGRLRPDMIVRLPGKKTVVVDAKSPLDSYLLALDAPDESERQTHLVAYANQIRGHITALSNKAYWEQFKPAPEFVFMFLPGESFYSAALEADPSLIEGGVNQRVILATPTTLIALLKAVAYGWRQERLAEDAEKIGNLGKELYERVCTLGGHFLSLGSSLRTAVEKYNDAVGTLESRVLVSARRFKDMPITATDKEIKPTNQIETIPRHLQTPELSDLREQPIILNRAQDFSPHGTKPSAAE
jgi:DNA recombination protein RmuC